MKKKPFQFHSLYIKLVVAVIISIAFGFLAYFIIDTIIVRFVYSDLVSKEYNDSELEKTVTDFQDYVTANSVSTNDYKSLYKWSINNSLVYFYIMQDESIIFDSSVAPFDYSEEELKEYYATSYADIVLFLEGSSSYYKKYAVSFSNGDAYLYIFGDFQYSLYVKLAYINIFISIILGLLLLSLIIRKKISYINDINAGINILEGGNLDYAIPVTGSDELAQLADSLNSMRIALSQQMENEKKALRANSSLVTALSHDLRTPLTTQMGYLEILKEHHYNSPDELDKYVNTALDTCHQIKEMSDRLFEYFLAFDPHPERPLEALEEYDGMELFMQLFAEHTIPLENQGFTFTMDFPEESFKILVNMDDILRIFNNIFSNIDKYADENSPVTISINNEAENCTIQISNKIRHVPRKNESSKIGLISISSLMKRQGGTSLTKTTSDTFTLQLALPTHR